MYNTASTAEYGCCSGVCQVSLAIHCCQPAVYSVSHQQANINLDSDTNTLQVKLLLLPAIRPRSKTGTFARFHLRPANCYLECYVSVMELSVANLVNGLRHSIECSCLQHKPFMQI